MKQDQNLRFVIIGMGYLMEYIAPCYSKLLGDKKAEQMLGVTAEPQAVQSKAKATGIPVILNDNAGALRRMEPDIILFAPPPSLAAPLTESVLVPYFAECRAAGKELPMLFAFPPKPEGKYYQEQLGHDCKVVNILPNMISEICGRTCAEAGFTMVTLPESHTWQPEELDFIRRFWQPLGQVVFLTPAEVQVALAVSCSNQMLSEIFLDMQTALPEAYRESASALAEAARAYLMEKLGYQPPQPVESSVQAVPPAMLEAVKKVTYHAHRGTLKFMLEKGFDADKAETIQRMNYDLNLRKVQLMPREELRRATRHHATRGGVLERACISYTQNWQDSVCSHFAKYPDWTPDAQWAEALEDGFVQMSQDVFDHLSQLAKKKEESVCDSGICRNGRLGGGSFSARTPDSVQHRHFGGRAEEQLGRTGRAHDPEGRKRRRLYPCGSRRGGRKRRAYERVRAASGHCFRQRKPRYDGVPAGHCLCKRNRCHAGKAAAGGADLRFDHHPPENWDRSFVRILRCHQRRHRRGVRHCMAGRRRLRGDCPYHRQRACNFVRYGV